MGSSIGSITGRQLARSRPVLSRSRHTLTTLRQQPRFYRRDDALLIYISPPIENSSHSNSDNYTVMIIV